ncbi:MAG: hypothetical protein N5P05_003781 [Chroococcopsis gigantea SAG 12.99]|jgi:gamma-glutamylcyclotransferase (GGCT)/AIG2-like uncharacterized protein YtfP|nr:gamma-glutamylcyclotransferase [Chlorogloea purpurea SAG 13.99]MDV3002175.1 hypothetical protein [Chroococcopsis gigantea SAG 12.99]
MLKVFVYGTLKPGESNYPRYCEKKVIQHERVYTKGQLFHLQALGYPGLTRGDSRVEGVLLCFADESVLENLDSLEDYRSDRSPDLNEYQREKIEVYSLAGEPLGQVWGYIMSSDKIKGYGGVPVVSGWWTGKLAQLSLDK